MKGAVPFKTPIAHHRIGVVAGVLLLSFATLVGVSALASTCVWNLSSSVPRGLYRMDSEARIVHGCVVAFAPPPSIAALVAERHYLPLGAQLLKVVVGLPGDFVRIDQTSFSVNGGLVGTIAQRDSAGRPLTAHTFSRTLPSGLAVVATSARVSFDSRYFGPVPLSTLTVVVPIWTY